eukprot:CAMPEP_0174831302 /NCGR_PEP_ID=MMETSP1114-20130205/3015_1 /TAXON_ID=312471 /ORGANISM="Neobodo designis, Strain CCAP 1951/1" /LENGTH=714 /DNA_ID=CAMNT_0016065123 /DNA_START=216 /DNA_END=2360 /DNA_ORIENTATION=-
MPESVSAGPVAKDSVITQAAKTAAEHVQDHVATKSTDKDVVPGKKTKKKSTKATGNNAATTVNDGATVPGQRTSMSRQSQPEEPVGAPTKEMEEAALAEASDWAGELLHPAAAGVPTTTTTTTTQVGAKQMSFGNHRRPVPKPGELVAVAVGAMFIEPAEKNAKDDGYTLVRVVGVHVGNDPYLRFEGPTVYKQLEGAMPAMIAFTMNKQKTPNDRTGRPGANAGRRIFGSMWPFTEGDHGVFTARNATEVAPLIRRGAKVIIADLKLEKLKILDKVVTDVGSFGLMAELHVPPTQAGAAPTVHRFTLFVPIKHYFKREEDVSHIGANLGTALCPLVERDWKPGTVASGIERSRHESVSYNIATATHFTVLRPLVFAVDGADNLTVKVAKHFDSVGDPTADGVPADHVLQLIKHKKHECEYKASVFDLDPAEDGYVDLINRKQFGILDISLIDKNKDNKAVLAAGIGTPKPVHYADLAKLTDGAQDSIRAQLVLGTASDVGRRVHGVVNPENRNLQRTKVNSTAAQKAQNALVRNVLPRITAVVALPGTDPSAALVPTNTAKGFFKLVRSGQADRLEEDGVVFIAQNRNGTQALLVRVTFELLDQFGTLIDHDDDDDVYPRSLQALADWLAVNARGNASVGIGTLRGRNCVKLALAAAGVWACRARACGFDDDLVFRIPVWNTHTYAGRPPQAAAPDDGDDSADDDDADNVDLV